MYKMAAVLIACSVSLLATGTSSCTDAASSGCNAWWVTYSTGSVGDGSFGRSAGVNPVFTSNFTNVASSQDPLSATFSWMSSANSNTTSVTTSNYSNWSVDTSWSSDYDFVPYSSQSSSSSSYSSPYVSSYSNLTYTNNLASTLPSNSGGSVSSAFFSGGDNAYSSYMSAVYTLAYGSRTTAPAVVPSAPIGASALDAPEPGTFVGIGVGLALIAAQRMRHRRKLRK